MRERARSSKRVWMAGILAGAGVVVSGCAASGTAAGALEPGAAPGPVAFEWEQSRLIPSQGEIRASFPDGRDYRGTYSQITHPYLDDGGEPGWLVGDRPAYDQDFIATDLVRAEDVYTYRVFADLVNERGETLRCRFTLHEPSQGMAGGGTGECATDDGERIREVVLGARPAHLASAT